MHRPRPKLTQAEADIGGAVAMQVAAGAEFVLHLAQFLEFLREVFTDGPEIALATLDAALAVCVVVKATT